MKRRRWVSMRTLAKRSLSAGWLLWTAGAALCAEPASARREFRDLLPSHVECITCHDGPEGGTGCDEPDHCKNPFGDAFLDNGKIWNLSLAVGDPDGDGYTSGHELGDWDGDGALDHTPHGTSPGLRDVDQNECYLRLSTCPPETPRCVRDLTGERAVYECAAGGPHRHPTPLVDGVWHPIDQLREPVTYAESECQPLGVSQWFSYRMDCGGAGAEAMIEVEGGGYLSAYEAQDLRSEAPSREVACQHMVEPMILEHSALLRVVSAGPRVGRIRATCTPGTPRSTTPEGTLDLDEYPTCGRAAEVFDGETAYKTIGYEREEALRSGSLPLPAGCEGTPETDLWVRYRASCTGTMIASVVPSRFGYPASLGVFGAEQCPELSAPLACAFTPYPERDPAQVEVPVVEGDELLLRLWSSFSEEPLSIECVPGPEGCDACHPRATCEEGPDGGALSCTCQADFVGDGRLLARGGTGCTPEVCVESALSCGPHGECVRIDTDTEGCDCHEGFEQRGATCVDTLNCSSGPCSAPDRHTRCIELEPGVACACNSGYSPDPDSDPEILRCILVCGDGFRGPGEICDDGNLESGDGCSSECEVEFSYACYEPFGTISQCENTCGNGLIDENEDCPEDRDAPPRRRFCAVADNLGQAGGGAPWWMLLLLPAVAVFRRAR